MFSACNFIKVEKTSSKAAFLSKAIMVQGNVLEEGNDFIDTSAEPVPDTTQPVLDTINECSNNVTQRAGTNIVQSVDGVVAQLIAEDGAVIKTFGLESSSVRKKIRSDLINYKQLKLDMTGVTPDRNVDLRLCDFNDLADCLVGAEGSPYGTSRHHTFQYANLFTGEPKMIINDDLTLSVRTPNRKTSSMVLMDVNERDQDKNLHLYAQNCAVNEIGEEICIELPPTPSAPVDTTPEAPSAPVECDYNHSPLLIDLKGDGVSLTSPMGGVVFDIKGDGEKLLISWPNSGDDLLLALPKKGKVSSVHELFGNNTVGPDFKKAANGFEALKKYDVNKDGFINKQDPIFTKLRLFKDVNMDGKSEPSELLKLSEFGITSFDLNYVDMYEKDKFHNETKQRSIAYQMKGEEKELLMVFDVWFRGISPAVIGK